MPISFRAKFILLVGAAVLFDPLLSGGVALFNVRRLSNDATTEIEAGLTKANQEYLRNYIETTALRADLLLDQAFSEVTALAGTMQTLIDQPQAKVAIGQALLRHPHFASPLAFDKAGGWAQNAPGNTSIVSVWGYLLDEKNQPKPEVMDEVYDSAVFDLFGGNSMQTGAKKLHMYYVGPKNLPIMRTTPYSEQAQTFDKLYPGHNVANFWDFFFPGVYEGRQGWIKYPTTRAENPQNELFGVKRLYASAYRYRLGSAAEIVQGIIANLMKHIGTQKVFDDITLVVMRHR